jgi:hypothetical protein
MLRVEACLRLPQIQTTSGLLGSSLRSMLRPLVRNVPNLHWVFRSIYAISGCFTDRLPVLIATSAFLWLLSAVYSIIAEVPINNQIASMAKGAAPADWKPLRPPPLGSHLKNQKLRRENFQKKPCASGGFGEGGTARLKHRLTAGLCGGSIISLCSVTSEFSSYAISIDIHLLHPDGARSMAEFKECRLEWSWILIGTLGGGGRDSESAQAS